jgi:predicted oxidoreductase
VGERVGDVIVVGAGLAGLVAATQLADAGRSVTVLDGGTEDRLGGQAHWSFGGLFMVATPEQRRLGIKDSADYAMADWTAGAEWTDSPADRGGRRWAEAYITFAAGEMRAWLHELGVRWFPVVQWPERGGYLATGPGSSVPRFHITWGTGPGLLEPFVARARGHQHTGRLQLRFGHHVDEVTTTAGAVDGVTGTTADGADFALSAGAVVIATGGIGGNHDLVRRFWPEHLGTPPRDLLQGVPDSVDGSGLELAERAGAELVNMGRMWNYPEGVPHHTPRWHAHAARLICGPSSVWTDATGRRFPPPNFPLHDTLATFEEVARSGHDHSWFVANRKIVSDEWSLSGSAHNPDLTGRSVRMVLQRALPRPFAPVQTFMDRVPDFVTADDVPALVRGMNELTGEGLVDERVVHDELRGLDRALSTGLHADAQLAAMHAFAQYTPNKLMRFAGFARYLDPRNGPLVAARLRILTRKTLGGVHTDLAGRVRRPDGDVLDGLYAIGEVAGFGGGAFHGRRSMEGTFLGGCLFSGRQAAADLAARL